MKVSTYLGFYLPPDLLCPGDPPGSNELQADPVSLNAQPRLLLRFGLGPLSSLHPPSIVSITVSIGKTNTSTP